MQPLERHYWGLPVTTDFVCNFGEGRCPDAAVRIEVMAGDGRVTPTGRCRRHIGHGLGDLLLPYEAAHAWVGRAVEEERAGQRLIDGQIADMEQENARLREAVEKAQAAVGIQAFQKLAEIATRSHEHRFEMILTESSRASDTDPKVQYRRVELLGCVCGVCRRVE